MLNFFQVVPVRRQAAGLVSEVKAQMVFLPAAVTAVKPLALLMPLPPLTCLMMCHDGFAAVDADADPGASAPAAAARPRAAATPAAAVRARVGRLAVLFSICSPGLRGRDADVTVCFPIVRRRSGQIG